MICNKCEVDKQESEFHFRQDSQRYRNSCKDCRNAEARLKRKLEPERFREVDKRSKTKNSEKVKARTKEYRKNHAEIVFQRKAQYRSKNKEYLKLSKIRWREENRDKHRAQRAKRRAAKKQATPKWADGKAIGKIYNQAIRFEAWLGIPFHVDHIIPLINEDVCGLHCEFNLRAIPATENLNKGNKFKGLIMQEFNYGGTDPVDPNDNGGTGNGDNPVKPK